MKRFKSRQTYLLFILILSAFLIPGCGHWSSSSSTPATPPTVTLAFPLNNATGVAINTAMTATFTVAMDPTTITTATFTLTQGGAAVAGTVTYSGVTAVFTPTASLAANTVYTATITTGAKNTAGTALASNYVWTFTTGAAPDLTPPTVTLTVPATAATSVPINTAITATFSKFMNPTTITNQTFTLTSGGTAVAGTVAYSGVTAVFTPTASLAASTTYTATITTGAKDATLNGNALASNYVWTFTTAAAPDLTPPTVSLTVPANAATGVAINTAISATFSKAMNPLTITNQTFTLTSGGTAVAGTVAYSGVTAVFTPTASLAASTTYTATITTGAKDATLNGNALASNYVWTFTTAAAPDLTPPTVSLTVPANAATGVAINTAISATFSKAMNPLTITNQTFTLTSGGTAVAGTVAYSGVTAVFTPTASLAASTTYTATITTGAKDATLNGNALASNYVWTFTTAAAPDLTPPTVSLTVPANAATGVAINTAISATFSKAMNPLTITNQTFTLTSGGTAVAGTVAYSGVTAVFTPTASLAASTTYTATITTGAKDATLTGNALASNYVWTFTTAAAPDLTPPTVRLTVPVNAATGVAINTAISATFSKAMNPLTITNQTFTLTTQGGTAVPGVVTYSGFTAVFIPTASLAASTTYTATITTGAKDATLTGNALASNYVWTFTTGLVPNDTSPTVIEITGNSNRVLVTFSEAMNPLTINNLTLTLTPQGSTTAIPGDVTSVGIFGTFTPTTTLGVGTYTVTVTTGAKDLAGNPLASNSVFNFAIVSPPPPPVTTPVVTLEHPTAGATGVCINTTIAATFSEAMNPLTFLPTANFTVQPGPPLGSLLGGLVGLDLTGTIATFTPTLTLAPSTKYTATIPTGGVQDLNGNGLASTAQWSFTTGTGTCTPPVALGSASTYAVVAQTLISNAVPGTVITGNMALSPSPIAAVTGFTGNLASGGNVIGTIWAADATSVNGDKSSVPDLGTIAAQAVADARTAYLALQTAGNLPGYTTVAGDLGGTTLFPGVYHSTSTLAIGSPVTLDPQGDPNATWIIDMNSSLTTTVLGNVVMVSPGSCANVYWRVGSSATLGAPIFCGTILADVSITQGALATATTGRLLIGGVAGVGGAVTFTGSAQTVTVP